MARLQAPGGILSYFTRHGTAANLLLVGLVVLGLTAFPNLRAQFFPDVVVERVSVSVTWDGAGAEDVDAAIVELLEPALLAVDGVTESSSTSREGSARISLEFEPGWDMARATEDVQLAVDGVSNLPEEAEEPTVRRGAWRDRVTDVVVTGPVGVDQVARIADEFVARLFAAGVTRASIRGIAAEQVIVEVESAALIGNDVTMREIAQAIAAEAETDPAGEVAEGARLRTGVARRSAAEIAEIALRANPDGTVLRIGDIAALYTEGVDRERSYFVGEDPAISIRVDRNAEGDAIEMQRTVEEVAAAMSSSLPEGVRIDLIRTRAEAITGRLSILLQNGLTGLALVVGLLFLFLNARTALWVAAGIPVAMTAAFAIMYLSGLTLNMISLFALLITLGIVVDDAIVVGEHADFRARRLGEPPLVAAENAARRMFMPVFAASLTTIIAFFGLVAVGGRFGDLIADIPFTVIVVLIASLVECFLILPNHMAHALKHTAREHWYDWPSRQVNKGFRFVRDRLFRAAMGVVIRARYPVLAGAIAILAGQISLFIQGDVTWRFFNAPEQGSISGNFAMAPGATRNDTLEMMRSLQATVDAVADRYEAEHGRNPVAYVLSEVGGTTGRGLAGEDTKDSEQLGSIAIELIDADLRPYSSFAFLADVEAGIERHPLVETISFRGWRSGPGGDALDIEISGTDTSGLKEAAEWLKTEAAKFPEVSALEDSMAYDKQELVLDLTPQGRALGLDIEGLGATLRDMLGGIEAATYPVGTRSAAIRVELSPGELTADFIDRVQIRTSEGDYIPLADVVSVERRSGFATIRRENGTRVISVTGDISEDDPARAAEISSALADDILPRLQERFGVATAIEGLAEQERDFLSDALTGLVLCLAGIYLALAWVFASWTRPVVVMAIIPFGLVGTIYGHHAWDVPLSMFSVVGLIGLVGIIINDSIVLVTTVDDYATERGLVPAIIDGSADRLRPVLLTTLTTVLGLSPLLFEGSQQAQFLKPSVITLVYGMGVGMFFVLLVVPALIAIQHDMSRLRVAARRALGRPRRSGHAGAGAIALGLASAAWFAATLGATIVAGGVPVWLGALVPALAGAGVWGAFGLYVAGVLGLALLVAGLSGLWARRAV